MEQSVGGSSKEDAVRLLKAGRIDDAIGVLGDLCRQDPDDAQVHMYLGIAYGHKNDKLHAIHHLEVSCNIEDNPRAYYNLGMIYESAHRVDEAVRQYKMAVELDPNYALAREALNKLHSKHEAAHIPVAAAASPATTQPASGMPSPQDFVPPTPAPPSGPPDFAEIQAKRDLEVIEQQKRMMKAGLIYGIICGMVFITMCYLALTMYLGIASSFTTMVYVVTGGAVYGGIVGFWIGTTSGGDDAGMQAGAVLGAIGGVIVGLIVGAGIYTLVYVVGCTFISGVVGMFVGRLVEASIAQV